MLPRLALWHALLKTADGCLAAPYDDRVITTLDYWEARKYPDTTPEAKRPPPRTDPLLTTCDALAAKCPKLRICDQTVKVFTDFHHDSIHSDFLRHFNYTDRHGEVRGLSLPNNMPKNHAGGEFDNREFIRAFGLDLPVSTQAARSKAQYDPPPDPPDPADSASAAPSGHVRVVVAVALGASLVVL